jgi:hypothetical protein
MDTDAVRTIGHRCGECVRGIFFAQQGKCADNPLPLYTEHKTSLIKRPIIWRAIVDASNKIDGGMERELCDRVHPCLGTPFGFPGQLVFVDGFDTRGSCCPNFFGGNKEGITRIAIDDLTLVREDRLTGYDPRFSLSLLTSGNHGLIWKRIKIIYCQISGNGDVLRRRVSNVLYGHLYPKIDAGFIIGSKARGFDFGQHNPWSRRSLVCGTIDRVGFQLCNPQSPGYKGINYENAESQHRYPIIRFAEIAACLVATAVFLFFGLPERSPQGVILTIGGILSLVTAVLLALQLGASSLYNSNLAAMGMSYLTHVVSMVTT